MNAIFNSNWELTYIFGDDDEKKIVLLIANKEEVINLSLTISIYLIFNDYLTKVLK